MIDEKIGRRIGSKELEGKVIGRIIDMLVHPQVRSRINVDELRNIVLDALQLGGMSIDKNDTEKVVEFIGVENAMKCTSLPGYQKLMDGWAEKL